MMNGLCTLSENSVHHEYDQGKESRRSNNEPDNMADQYPGEKGADVVHIEGSGALDGEPLEMDLESSPGSCCGSQEFFLCWAVEVRHVRKAVQDFVADCWGGTLRSELCGLCIWG
jgi:hypothetical protein